MLGHVSARAPETDGYWVKRARLGLAEVTSEILVMVDLDGHRLKGYGALHGELPIYAELDRRRSDVRCVVHPHPLVACQSMPSTSRNSPIARTRSSHSRESFHGGRRTEVWTGVARSVVVMVSPRSTVDLSGPPRPAPKGAPGGLLNIGLASV